MAYILAIRSAPLWADRGNYSVSQLLRAELLSDWLINPSDGRSWAIAMQDNVDVDMAFQAFIHEAVEIEGVSLLQWGSFDLTLTLLRAIWTFIALFGQIDLVADVRCAIALRAFFKLNKKYVLFPSILEKLIKHEGDRDGPKITKSSKRMGPSTSDMGYIQKATGHRMGYRSRLRIENLRSL
jgi:hypothetical protein